MKSLASIARVAAPVTASLVFLAASAAPSLADNGCGKASWYALHSKTASGERMDPSKLTAAHRSLRFGTKLQVTNRKTGKSVVVRVNDRGPFIRGRVLDVSKAAASHLGMVNSGVANVCFKVLS
ncbi:septal ring lytic transglycosylase RlpA family protein [Pseudohoeflea suaedae]|uniref:Endolytic peptidoglycan transglycosylase RlpA n=1 Tax=Pseudohoeflea suaedae TaxID=877384 RepID=A0A4R5PLR9_9HYPH|nr:septal ring lytic transglycosylase RlpA family protein [Pseudohoeflea suaedae]TDH37886.1 septal ring lytic transglycosylase RlpA family protein [Pseudohoeflea suaedae]